MGVLYLVLHDGVVSLNIIYAVSYMFYVYVITTSKNNIESISTCFSFTRLFASFCLCSVFNLML